MSQENVEEVRSLYDAFTHGGWDAMLAHLPPEFEWEADPRHPHGGIYRGLEKYRAFLKELDEPFEHTAVECEEFLDKGDHVVAFLIVRRRPRGSGAEMEIHAAAMWTFRDRTPVRGQFFAERKQALKALQHVSVWICFATTARPRVVIGARR